MSGFGKAWRTVTGQRCPNCWLIYGTNFVGLKASKEVRCDRPKGHAGKCRNTGHFHWTTTRDFTKRVSS